MLMKNLWRFAAERWAQRYGERELQADFPWSYRELHSREVLAASYFSDLRRSQSVTILVGSMASLSSCISTTLPLLSIR
jgi:hypothetical protein